MTTPRLSITTLILRQSNAEITVNSALNLLDTFAAGVNVKDRDLTAPPGSPVDGDVYIPAATATGDWAGQEGDFAVYFNGWLFVTPAEGMTAYIADEDKWLVYDGTNWNESPVSVETGVAAAGATQGAATQLTEFFSEVTSATASSADGVKLLPAVKGRRQEVANKTGITINVFPSSSDAIDDQAADTAVTLTDNETGVFTALDGTTWLSNVGVMA